MLLLKFTLSRSQFVHVIQTVSRAVDAKTTKPVLSGILFQVINETLTVTGYNLELGIVYTLQNSEVSRLRNLQPGQAVLPGKPLLELVRRLPEDDVTLYTTSSGWIELCCGQMSCRFPDLNAALFPVFPKVNHTQNIQTPAHVLRRMIRGTAFAASASESRPTLAGVHFTCENRQFTLVATDSVRLAQARTRLAVDVPWHFDAIVPAKSLLDVFHILPESDDWVTICMTDSHGLFRVGDVEVYTRLMGGSYLDVTKLIPTSYIVAMTMGTEALVQTIERASVFAAKSQEVVLRTNGNQIVITAHSAEVGEFRDVLPTSAHASDTQVACHAKNLLDALRACDAPRVTLGMNGSLQPFSVSADDSDLLHVISPMITRVYDQTQSGS